MKVLTVGNSLKYNGGIAAVLNTYSRCFPDFRFSPTNSAHGTLAGLFNLGWTMVKLPFYRLAGYDILHVHGCSGKSFRRKRVVMAWSRLLGFRNIFHCHGGEFAGFSEKYGMARVSAILGKCSAVIVLGDYWETFFRQKLGLKDVFVLPNIVEPPKGPIERPSEVNESAPLKVLFLGLVCRDKGVYDIVEALKLLAPEYDGRIEVVFAGPGETDRLREAIDRAGVASMASVVGLVRGAAKEKCLGESRLMLLPSYIEGLPITLLEACAYGIPSVTTPVGSIAELIADGVNGTLVEPGHPEQIAAALRRYADNPALLKEQGSAALKAVAPYLPENVGRRLHEIYSFVDRYY